MAATGSRSIFTGSVTLIQHHHGHMHDQNALKDTLKELADHSAIAAHYDSKERYDPPKCHKDTRSGILQTIIDWTGSGDPNMLWLYGSAGAGKSAIAQSTAESLASLQSLAASFFFSRTASGTYQNSEERFVFTIASQLASTIPGLAPYVQEAIAKTPYIWGLSLASQASILILEPLRKFTETVHPTVHPTTYPHVIIVDGLDECRKDSDAQMQVLEVLDSLSNPSAAYPFKILVVSRPEYEIKAWFDSFLLDNVDDAARRLQIFDLDSFPGVHDDIRRFFRDKIAEIRQSHPMRHYIPDDWPSEALIEEMARRAAGHFIYAATLMRYIISIRHVPNERLESILNQTSVKSDRPFAQLDRLYLDVFRNAEELDLVRQLLALHILHLQSPFTSMGIIPCQEAIATLLSHPSLKLDIPFMDLHSIIKYPKNPDSSFPYEFYHASMADFLQDPIRSEELFVDVEQSREEYAVKALQRIYETVDGQCDGHALPWIWYFFWQLCWSAPLSPTIKANLEYWSNMQDSAIDQAVQTLRFRYTEAMDVTPIMGLVSDEDKPIRVRGRRHLHPAAVRILQSRFLGPLQSRLRAYRNCPDLPIELLALVAVWDPHFMGKLSRSHSFLALTSQIHHIFCEKYQQYPNKEEIFNPIPCEDTGLYAGWCHLMRFLNFWDMLGPEFHFSSKDFTAASIFFLKHIIQHFDSILSNKNVEDLDLSAGLLSALVAFSGVLSRSSLSSELAVLIRDSGAVQVASSYCDSEGRVSESEYLEHQEDSAIEFLKAYVEIFHDLSGFLTNDPKGVDTLPGDISHRDLDEMSIGVLVLRAGLGDKYGTVLDLYKAHHFDYLS